MHLTLQVVDGLLLLGGMCIILRVAWRLARHGSGRDPLCSVSHGSGGPTALAAGAVLALFLGLQTTLLIACTRGFAPEQMASPGTHPWHLAQSADAAAKLLISAVMLLVLRTTVPRAASAPSLSVVRRFLAGIAAFLAILPLITVQWEMGTVLWRALNPDAVPPMHAVLRALRDSAWGGWGAVQLLFGAVVVAPLAEELFFRGLLLHVLLRHLGQRWLAITGSAVLFGLAHVTQPQDVLPLVTMGVILGYLRLRTGALWPCILVHTLFNARTMTLALLAPELLNAC